MEKTQYQIYNASAGSGKTFTLVKSFLKIILKSKNPDTFKSLLAITFTNKAVNEMKGRIIETLMVFSDINKATNHQMFHQISEELKISTNNLCIHSYRILKQILHNYAALTILTIDGFNHRLIRAFAFDLELNPNFEVFMDTQELLDKSIDKLLEKTAENKEITQILIDFSKEKIKENKNWEITHELKSVAELSTIENNYEYLKHIEKKSLKDFKNLTKNIKQKIIESQKKILENTQHFFDITEKYNLDKKSFNGGYLYNFYTKVKESPQKDENINSLSSLWATSLEDKPLYAKTLQKSNPEIALILDQNHQKISQLFREIEKLLHFQKFYKKILKDLIPLTILSSIIKEAQIIKEEENILPISEFNNIIYQTISNEPIPFIYERIGQKYKHFFIDEFQDTSTLQWNNISPLIADALQSETLSKTKGSLLLVGDAKQSIYRWRGGKTEQFINLYLENTNPFFIKPTIFDLDKNFRSSKEIISFNNSFFNYISQEKQLFSTDLYKNLYKNSSQNSHEKTKQNGFISIEFIDEIYDETENIDNANELNNLYYKAICKYIEDALNCGFTQQDICILTRTNNQGVGIAQYLTTQQYTVISPDALLLKNIIEIRFLINLIKISLTPDNKEFISELLLLYAQIKNINHLDIFITKYLENPIEVFFETVNFSMKIFHQYSFYEGVSYAIEKFKLAKESDAYLTHFLDLIFEFKNSKRGGIADFLNFWEQKKDKISISSPSGLDAISVMTVHKSKGLEFPVIIYAFVNDKLIEKHPEKLWLKISPEQYNGFNYLLISNYSGLEFIDNEIVTTQKEQSLLDKINIMYVAMTRPESHLYIIGQKNYYKKNPDIIKNFSDILKQFLIHQNLWNENQLVYTFGEKIIKNQNKISNIFYIPFTKIHTEQTNYKIVTKLGALWNTEKQYAIEKGNILHNLMAKIENHKDLNQVIKEAQKEGIISNEQQKSIKEQILKIINHPQIAPYFQDGYQIFNEVDFINENGKFERPDRVAISKENKNAVIIDYKTGKFLPKYQTQIKQYAKTISQIGYSVNSCFLVFINSDIEVITV